MYHHAHPAPELLPSFSSTPTTPEVAVGVGLLGIEGGVHPLQRDSTRGSWDEMDEILGFLWDDYGMMMG
jgi:hypothetical protein